MLLLLTIGLVLIGLVALVIGFVTDALLPIYISIFCSLAAAVVLFIFSRISNRSAEESVGAGRPAPVGQSAVPAYTPTWEPSVATGATFPAPAETPPPPVDHFAAEPAVTSAAEPAADVLPSDFPIENYDRLRVGEILPLLSELELDDLDIVREHEESGRRRATVLARIGELESAMTADEPTATVDEVGPAEEPAAGPAVAEPALTDAGFGSDAVPAEEDEYFPIEDYDELRINEIVPLLPELDDDELEMVLDRESAGANRFVIIRRIRTLLGTSGTTTVPAPPVADAPAAAPEPEPQSVPAPVPAKRAPAVAKAASKSAAGKSAAPAKAPAAKAPAAKAPAAKAPAAKKAPTKAPAAKAPAAKAPAKAAPVKARATKAAPAQAAPPVKARAAKAVPVPVPVKAPAKATPSKSPAAKAPAAKAPAAKAPAAKGPAREAAKEAAPAKAAKAAKAAKPTRPTRKG